MQKAESRKGAWDRRWTRRETKRREEGERKRDGERREEGKVRVRPVSRLICLRC